MINAQKKNKRDLAYQKKYLKRITVWFNTKNEDDMKLLDYIENEFDTPKSESIKNCIRESMNLHQSEIKKEGK